jgi:hypothetical protein
VELVPDHQAEPAHVGDLLVLVRYQLAKYIGIALA